MTVVNAVEQNVLHAKQVVAFNNTYVLVAKSGLDVNAPVRVVNQSVGKFRGTGVRDEKRVIFPYFWGCAKKHMACRKKYKPYILKYVPCILK